MKHRKLVFLSAIVVMISVILLLVSGSSFLTMALDNEESVPAGTFITWAGIISLPLAIFMGIKEMRKPTNLFNSILSGGIKLTLILAILWVPISYLLAGNLSFSFSEKTSFQGGQLAMKYFWYLSFGIAIIALAILIIYWISLLFLKQKSATSED